MTKKYDVKRLAILAMFCALAFAVVALIRIPITPLPFLKYEPKDVIIVLSSFILGPVSALVISVVVSLIEMITISESGIIGCAMNILASCSFACTAGLIYRRKKTLGGAIIGLAAGLLFATGLMLLWNYMLTPLYMKVDRADIVAMLLPVFLPFNLIKNGLNGAIVMLLYKPVVTALRKAKLLPESESEKENRHLLTAVVSVVAIATFVLLALVLKGVIQ